MTTVPIEAVALKLFTGIENFEIMAIPFFILAGNFLTHGGVARRMIDFATSHGRPLVWRPRPRRRRGLRAVRGDLRLVAGDRGGDRLDPAAGDGRAGLSEALRRRRHHHLRRARHPDPALDRHGDLRGRDRRQRRARSGRQARAVGLGRAAVHRRRHAGPDARVPARHHDLLPRLEERLSAPAEGDLGRALDGVPRFDLGPAADRAGAGRHLLRACSRRPRPPPSARSMPSSSRCSSTAT